MATLPQAQLAYLALGDSYKGHRIVGTNHSYVEHYGGKLKYGKLWQADMEATIGSSVADRLKLRIGNLFYGAHGLGADDGHTHEEHAYKVVGVLEPTGTVLDQLLLTNVSSVWRVHEGHDDPPAPDSLPTDSSHA